jgi:hypothetical protein
MLDQVKFNAEVDAFLETPVAKEFGWSRYLAEDALDRPCAVLTAQRRFEIVGAPKRIHSSGRVPAVLGAETVGYGSWEDEDDDLRVPASTSTGPVESIQEGTASSSPCALLTYFILYSEAYQIPVLYVDARKGVLSQEKASSSAPMSWALLPAEELQSVLPGCNCCCETSADEASGSESPWLQPSSLPLLTPSFCDLLNRGMYHLHPCDAQSTLAAMQARNLTDSGPGTQQVPSSSSVSSYPHATVLGRFLCIVDVPFRLREHSSLGR